MLCRRGTDDAADVGDCWHGAMEADAGKHALPVALTLRGTELYAWGCGRMTPVEAHSSRLLCIQLNVCPPSLSNRAGPKEPRGTAKLTPCCWFVCICGSTGVNTCAIFGAWQGNTAEPLTPEKCVVGSPTAPGNDMDAKPASHDKTA